MISLALLTLLAQEEAPLPMPEVAVRLQDAVRERNWDTATRHLDYLVAEHQDWLVSGQADYATCYAVLRTDYERSVAMPTWPVLFACDVAEYDEESERFRAQGTWGMTHLFTWRQHAQERVTSIPVAAPFELELEIPGTPWNRAPKVVLLESERPWDWDAERPSTRGRSFRTGYAESRFDGSPQAGGWLGPDGSALSPLAASAHRCSEALNLVLKADEAQLRAEVPGDQVWVAEGTIDRPTEVLLEVARTSHTEEVGFRIDTRMPRAVFHARVDKLRDARFRSWAQRETRETELPDWLRTAWLESGDWASPFYGFGGRGGRVGGRALLEFRYPALQEVESEIQSAGERLLNEVNALLAQGALAEAVAVVREEEEAGILPPSWTSSLLARVVFLQRDFSQVESAAEVVLEASPYHPYTHLLLAEIELRKSPEGADWLAHLADALSGARLSDRYAAAMLAHRLGDPERAMTFGIRVVATWNLGLKLDRMLPRNLQEGPSSPAGVSHHAAALSWSSFRGEQPDAALIRTLDSWANELETKYGSIPERLRLVQFTRDSTLARYLRNREAGFHRQGKVGFHTGMDQIFVAGRIDKQDLPDLKLAMTQAWIAQRYRAAPSWFREAMRQQLVVDRAHLAYLAGGDQRRLESVLWDPTMLALSFSALEESSSLPAAFLLWLSEAGSDQQALYATLLASFGATDALSPGSWPEIDTAQLRAWEPEFRAWLDSEAR